MNILLHDMIHPLRIGSDGFTIYIGQTRVPIDTVLLLYQDGWTPEQMAQNFPALTLAQIHHTIGYYLEHQDELDVYLAESMALHDAIEQENRRLMENSALYRRWQAYQQSQNS